ncbi:MAG: WhiB family transcriptional regulator [Pseudonocardiaceae bacterium]
MAMTDHTIELGVDTWRDNAACRDADVSIFFPEPDGDSAPAKAICAVCPVKSHCLDFALASRQDDGVWGGLDEAERRRRRRRQQEASRAARRAGQAA